MPITERDLLDEIGNIITHSDVHGVVRSSKERARNFFDPLQLSPKLRSYIQDSRRQSISGAAKMFGMSAQTLKSIIDGGPLSENMLFRLRNSLEYASQHPGVSVERDEDATYFGDWRRTDTKKIQIAIAEVADKLIFIKKVIESSNSLNSEDSPIDKIQIAQLIALLEATLAAIKGPFIETGQTAGFFNWLKKVGRRGVENGIEAGVSSAIGSAVDSGSELLKNLREAASTSDLGSIIK